MLADRYELFRGRGEGTAFHQPDLSVAFFEKALRLASRDGVIAMLMPSKIVNAAYAGPLRRLARGRVTALDDWSDDPRRRRWFAADTFPLGVLCGRPSERVHVSAAGESFQLPRAELSVGCASSEWALVPPAASSIMQRLRAAHPPLEEALARRPLMGVKTGDNSNFFLDVVSVGSTHLTTADEIRVPLDAVCRCVRGRDLRRWRVDASQWMLWPPREGWRKPPKWLEKLAAARGTDPEAFRLSFVRAEHVGIKVAWKDLSRGMSAAVLPDVVHINGRPFPLVPNQTLYAIDAVSLDEAYLIAAVLNSTIVNALLVSVAERAKDAHYRYFGRTIAALPWCDIAGERESLVRLSRRAHSGGDCMRPIDEIVAGAFGVSIGELDVLRAFTARRIGADVLPAVGPRRVSG
jgi:hypothetical protein